MFLVQYITSKMGKTMLGVENFTFYKRQTVKEKQYWYCSTHRNTGCKAVAHTFNDIVIFLRNVHNH